MKPDLILFPDASLKRSGDKFFSGYGVVILNTHTGNYTTVKGSLSKDSIVYCEAWAIYQGLRFIEHLRKKQYPKGTNLKVLVVSDSKINIQIFTTWIKKSWDLSDWYDWKKSDKTSVRNQELYRNIMKVLSNGHLKVKFVHINSHSDKKPGMMKHIESKLEKANVNVNYQTLTTFIELNQVADALACSVTEKSKRGSKIETEFQTLIHKGE